ncbi:Transposase [Nocardia amikacinitolerans]|uniref:transposase n=1 Tax=Nocardia amikacinitolerans TaxID=756689 RepID=UPI001C3FC676|nr:transposase [Nocardia amikacinitolerans]MCP2321404.1 Transposase [Nocardia amikacinitolerans]
MTNPATLAEECRASLDAILAASPALAALAGHVRAFAEIMGERRGRDLERWMTAVDADDKPALHSFVRGLRRDQDAVIAGLTTPWSSGTVEGHVNRIILWNLKCQVSEVFPWRTPTIGSWMAPAAPT